MSAARVLRPTVASEAREPVVALRALFASDAGISRAVRETRSFIGGNAVIGSSEGTSTDFFDAPAANDNAAAQVRAVRLVAETDPERATSERAIRLPSIRLPRPPAASDAGEVGFPPPGPDSRSDASEARTAAGESRPARGVPSQLVPKGF